MTWNTIIIHNNTKFLPETDRVPNCLIQLKTFILFSTSLSPWHRLWKAILSVRRTRREQRNNFKPFLQLFNLKNMNPSAKKEIASSSIMNRNKKKKLNCAFIWIMILKSYDNSTAISINRLYYGPIDMNSGLRWTARKKIIVLKCGLRQLHRVSSKNSIRVAT